jgi:hypothetical protein
MTEISPIVARQIDRLRDRTPMDLNEASGWLVWMDAGAPGSDGLCSVCVKNHSAEDHHVAGRRHSDLTVPVCRCCHRRLSERQNGWDPHWLSDGRSSALDNSLLLRGLSDLSEERARTHGPAYHLVAKTLRAEYAYVAKGTIS